MPMSHPRNNNILSTAAALLITLAFPVSSASAASGLQLKTDDREVYGTREVEAGEYAAGIAKLETALKRSGSRLEKAPILNNLCVAYVATGDLEKATSYCQMAVEDGYDLDLAYNNRGVMNYVAGDIEASIRDFDLAVKLGYGYGVATKNLALLNK